MTRRALHPQNTMLALTRRALYMAIVSVHKIVTAKDRLTLDQEYNTIINKLALGNIESDYEMTGLYSELMNFITGKGPQTGRGGKVSGTL